MEVQRISVSSSQGRQAEVLAGDLFKGLLRGHFQGFRWVSFDTTSTALFDYASKHFRACQTTAVWYSRTRPESFRAGATRAGSNGPFMIYPSLEIPNQNLAHHQVLGRPHAVARRHFFNGESLEHLPHLGLVIQA